MPTRTSTGPTAMPGSASISSTEAQAGAHGALGVVLVQGGDAEDGGDGVADVLLYCAAIGLDGTAR